MLEPGQCFKFSLYLSIIGPPLYKEQSTLSWKFTTPNLTKRHLFMKGSITLNQGSPFTKKHVNSHITLRIQYPLFPAFSETVKNNFHEDKLKNMCSLDWAGNMIGSSSSIFSFWGIGWIHVFPVSRPVTQIPYFISNINSTSSNQFQRFLGNIWGPNITLTFD